MRATFLASIVCLSVLGLANAADVSIGQKMSTSIPAQGLGAALEKLAQERKLYLIFASLDVSNMRTQGASGELTSDEALKQLLSGTGLTYRFIDEKTVSILPKQPVAPRTTDVAAEPALHLVQVASDPKGSRPNSSTDAAAVSGEDSRGVPEILVKGNRSLNLDIERTEDSPQPYVVFQREEILRSQAVTLDDFLRTRLPMNTAAASPSQQVASAVPYSSINLRGLGPNQTLILVDGRRQASIANTGNFIQGDVNGIPLSAIERVEVLPSTAGGIYGGSATGGVINIILRRDFTGIEARANYANTFDTDAGATRLDVSGGFSLEGGRTRVTAAISRSETNILTVGDRDFAARGVALLLRNNPAAILGSATPPLGATVNIRSLSGNLILDNTYGGANLGSNITHVPLGYAGAASDSGAGLRANAGRYNLELPDDLGGKRIGLMGAPYIQSGSLSVRREFSPVFDAFVDLSTYDSRSRTASGVMPSTVANLAGTAPNNPFQGAIAVRFPSPGIAFDNEGQSRTLRATSGLIFRLPLRWTGEVDYSWSRSRYATASTASALQSIATTVMGNGLPAPDGRPALNVLQEGNTFPLDFTPYLLGSPNRFNGPNDTVLKNATLRLSGPLMQLPAGALNLSTMVEARQEQNKDGFLRIMSSATGLYGVTWYPSRSQETRSYYLEADVPLLRALELQASVRRDEYEIRSDGTGGYPVTSVEGPFPVLNYRTNELESTDYTLGLRYEVTRDLAVRASIGTGFLPPSITQVAPSASTRTFTLGPDPLRDYNDMYVGIPYTLVLGGNTELQPEESESLSAGLILTPRFAPGLRLSVDYTRISKKGEMQNPDPLFLMENAERFPGRIQRGPKLSTDDADWAGPISYIDLSLLNVATSTVEAFDIQADYVISTQDAGDFSWNVLTTWQPDYQSRVLPTSPLVNTVGYSGGPLEWRGNVGMTWDRGPWSMGWNAQFYASYFIYGATATAPGIAAAVLNQGESRVPRQTYHDVIASYQFDAGGSGWRGWFAGSEFSIGVQNLFDRSPPILAITGANAATGYSTYGDPRLRRYSISFRKSFN